MNSTFKNVYYSCSLISMLALAGCGDSELKYETSKNAPIAVGQNITSWSNLASSTDITAPIPDGIYESKSITFSDPTLVAANIVAGVTIFGVTGSASGLPAGCSTQGLQGSNCTAGAGTYWSSVLGTNTVGVDGSASTAVPAGYYNGSSTVTAQDSDLIASNIRSGTLIFGVTGSLVPAYSSCVDNALNPGQCSTSASRFVTSVNGGNVAGSAGSLSATIPLGFYDGTRTVTMSDPALVAANIRSGSTIFGVTGSSTAAYPACTDNALNGSQCSTAASRYVTSTSGSNVSGSNGSLSALIPIGFYDGTRSATMNDTSLLASNIRAGATIFGVNGTSTPAYAPCTDDALNSGLCSAPANRYVTPTSGSNLTGANGSLSGTIPAGYYDGTQTATMSDSALISSNIRSSTVVFGVTGSLTPAYSGCTDNTLNAGQCSTATSRYVTSINGSDVSIWLNTLASTTVTGSIPTGFYSGRSCNFTDTDLIANNIRSGTDILGVTGNLTPAYSACTDNSLNATACSTAANRYVASTLGSNVTGANASLSATIPAGYYDGTRSATMSDSLLIAGNIRSGVSIFGVTGSSTPAYAACVDNSSNVSQCSTAANRFVTPNAGSSVTVSGGTSATIPAGYYNGTPVCQISDVNLIASNIKSSVSVLGITGTYVAPTAFNSVFPSGINRDAGSPPGGLSVYNETDTYSGESDSDSDPANSLPSGVRDVPLVSADNGSATPAPIDRSGWGTTSCGLSSSTVAGRIADCAAVLPAGTTTWTPSASVTNTTYGVWKLVARSGDCSSAGVASPTTDKYCQEVWQDDRTKLLWSSRVAVGANWCMASGVHNSSTTTIYKQSDAGTCNGTCNTSQTCQRATSAPISLCFEHADFTTTDTVGIYSGVRNQAGKAGLGRTSSPRVYWRLPTRADYALAIFNGLNLVAPDWAPSGTSYEWTATIAATATQAVVVGTSGALNTSILRYSGANSNPGTSGSPATRCVGR